MEFWAAEVEPGKPSDVKLDEHTYLHISQVALGESKGGKGSTDRVVIRAHVGKQEVVIGTLVPGKCDQIGLDLIFHKGFKLSHNSTAYNVYFCGYTSESPGEEFSSDEEEDEDVEEPSEVAVITKANGKPGVLGKSVKSDLLGVAAKTETPSKAATKILAGAGKPGKDSKDTTLPSTGAVAVAGLDSKKVALKQSSAGSALKAGKKVTNVKGDSDDNDDENDNESDEDEDEDEDDDDDDDDDEDEEDDDEDDDEDDSDEDMEATDDYFDSEAEEEDDEDETPNLKKRAKPSNDTAKTPSSGKKQKLSKPGESVKPGVISTPGKKSGDKKIVTTPAVKEQKTPSQSATKTPGKQTSSLNDSKTPKQQTTPGVKESPVTPGRYHCAPCSRNFTTESALSQHKVAKHKSA